MWTRHPYNHAIVSEANAASVAWSGRGPSDFLPGELRSLEDLLTRADREVRLLGALTPREAYAERARLVGALGRRQPLVPRWTYEARSHADLRRSLECADRWLAHRADPLASTYQARLRELALEAAICEAAGTRALAALARSRFAGANPESEAAAAEACRRWLSEKGLEPSKRRILSDSPDALSLVSLIRAAVGAARLPFAVVPSSPLAALAATGDDVILVATGRLVLEEDARRTAIHEVEGHARPRHCARSAALAIFRVGTARGVDDQEGRAVLLEQRAGLLGTRRRRQLATRHWAVLAMGDGASFGDVARALVDDHGLEAPDAVVVAERVFRGSDGRAPGLGRERIYLDAFVRMQSWLALHPEDERVLASGQVGIDSVETLRPWTPHTPIALCETFNETLEPTRRP